MAVKIYLSPSNQNGNRYAYGSTNEMEQCNPIAAAAEKHLRRNGYEVKRAPKGQDMTQSVTKGNQTHGAQRCILPSTPMRAAVPGRW